MLSRFPRLFHPNPNFSLSAQVDFFHLGAKLTVPFTQVSVLQRVFHEDLTRKRPRPKSLSALEHVRRFRQVLLQLLLRPYHCMNTDETKLQKIEGNWELILLIFKSPMAEKNALDLRIRVSLKLRFLVILVIFKITVPQYLILFQRNTSA